MSILRFGGKVPVRQNLVKKYRPIGPAAIAAAVHAMKKRRPVRQARDARRAATNPVH